MYLRSLKVHSFRNLSDTEVSFHPAVNFITGENGQGKSNLIEAIHVLSATKTYRQVQQKDLIQWGQEGFGVFGEVVPDEAEIHDGSSIPLGVSVDGKGKKVFLDGQPTRAVSQYLKVFPAVTFVPKDVDLIYGAPSGRRRFLDRYCSIVSPQYLSALSAYQKVIRSKNAYLKKMGGDREQLRTLNELIADYGVRITGLRDQLLQDLLPFVQEFYDAFAQQDGDISLGLEETFLEKGAEQREREAYLAVLNEITRHELERRSTLVGPHLDDVEILLAGRSTKQFASQGQARSAVLSLLLALAQVIQSRIGVVPAILLDDFSSELDAGRMRRFFELLQLKSHQVFVTGTDLSAGAFGSKDSVFFEVQGGSICRL